LKEYISKKRKENAFQIDEGRITYGIVSVISHVFITLSAFSIKSATNVGHSGIRVIVVCCLQCVSILNTKSKCEANSLNNEYNIDSRQSQFTNDR
jgi:hypothetical protein